MENCFTNNQIQTQQNVISGGKSVKVKALKLLRQDS